MLLFCKLPRWIGVTPFGLLLLATHVVADVNRPHILFAISDDQSWTHAGAYGDRGAQTPAFDQIASQGVLFEHAFAAAPSCTASRSAILTGRNIWELEEAGQLMGLLSPKFELFTRQLQAAGYQLASTGKTWGPGRLEGFASDGQDQRAAVFGKTYQTHRLPQRRQGLSPLDYAANFAEFLTERDPERPFFFWFGASEPHQSYDVGAWQQAGKNLSDARLPACLPDDPVTRGEILDYGLEIEHFDTHLGRMIEYLTAAGELDNTLIIVTSDHGNPLPRSKCNLYDSGTRVPLAIRWPQEIPGGRRVNDFVNLIDLAPTILESAQLAVPEEMSGQTLWPVLKTKQAGWVDPTRDFVVTGLERHIITRRHGVGYPMRAIRTRRYAYIRNYEPDRWPAGDPDFYSSHQGFYGDCDHGQSKQFILENCQRPEIAPYYALCFGRRPAHELYDMERDPHQLHNLADEASHQEALRKLATRMNDYLTKTGDPRLRGITKWDTYPFSADEIFDYPRWQLQGKLPPLPE